MYVYTHTYKVYIKYVHACIKFNDLHFVLVGCSASNNFFLWPGSVITEETCFSVA